MQYKILSASLGYNGKVYMQGEFITLKSEKEAEELISFGCVITTLMEAPKEEENAEPIEPEVPKEDVKSISGGKVGSYPGGRKRK